jgi:hypothetical protein
MPHDFDDHPMFSDRPDDSLLEDFEVRCQNDVAALRGNNSTRTRLRVEVQDGNVADRRAVLTELQTTEVNQQGVIGLASRPVMVGSVFHLRFERGAVSTPATLAVCDRCTMLGDESFELRFRSMQRLQITDDHDDADA